jgi:hypothetical protein
MTSSRGTNVRRRSGISLPIGVPLRVIVKDSPGSTPRMIAPDSLRSSRWEILPRCMLSHGGERTSAVLRSTTSGHEAGCFRAGEGRARERNVSLAVTVVPSLGRWRTPRTDRRHPATSDIRAPTAPPPVRPRSRPAHRPYGLADVRSLRRRSPPPGPATAAPPHTGWPGTKLLHGQVSLPSLWPCGVCLPSTRGRTRTAISSVAVCTRYPSLQTRPVRCPRCGLAGLRGGTGSHHRCGVAAFGRRLR